MDLSRDADAATVQQAKIELAAALRWAARLLHGAKLKDNVNGTDLVPQMFSRWADRGLRYYLLGMKPFQGVSLGYASAMTILILFLGFIGYYVNRFKVIER